MIRNYLKIACRNLWRNKMYAVINIVGLAVGMAAVLVIARFVYEELAYDTHHALKDRIYRIITVGADNKAAYTQPVLAGTLEREIPGIEKVARLDQHYQDHNVIRIGNQLERVAPFYFADPEIVDILTIPFVQGDPHGCLGDPRSVVISSAFARRYFPEINPLDQILTIQYRGAFYDMKVTAVLGEMDKNSLFNPEILLPMSLVAETSSEDWGTSWGYNSVMTLVLLRQNVSAGETEVNIASALSPILPEWYTQEYGLQPLSRAHLYSTDIRSRMGVYGSIDKVRLYSGIALAILLIACINFVNLGIAQGTKRLKEMGIRKVVGAGRTALIVQSVGEALLITLMALPVAVVFLEIILPVANQMLSRQMDLSLTGNLSFYLSMFFVTLLIGTICGGITALYLSSIHPATLISDRHYTFSANPWFRRMMIAFQFIAFSGLMVASLVIRNQMDYMLNMNPGYNTEQIVVLSIPDSDHEAKHDLMKTMLLENTAIEEVSITSSVPPWFGNWMSSNEDDIWLDFIVTDKDYLHTLDIPLLNGRNLREEDRGGFLLNETAFQKYFPGETFHEGMTLTNDKTPVIGVMKDFHVHPLYNMINPLTLMARNPDNLGFLACIAVRLAAGQIREGIAVIQKTWNDIYPEDLFTYRFVDEELDRQYQSDQIFAQMIHFFTVLAVVVASMGLFGLAVFAAERRTKEIGIRKVLGASVGQVVSLLNREFFLLVLVANIIAWPAAYFIMNRWLQNFAYHISIGWWIFILSGVSALIISMLTVSWQAIRAATANPVESLRYE